MEITADRVVGIFQTGQFAVPNDPFERLIADLHRANAAIWKLEDQIRSDDDEVQRGAWEMTRIRQGLNQMRTKLISQIDSALHTSLTLAGDLHSETPGMMIDRLSILWLKRNVLTAAEEQFNDLKADFNQAMTDIESGTRQFKIYHHQKVYADERTD